MYGWTDLLTLLLGLPRACRCLEEIRLFFKALENISCRRQGLWVTFMAISCAQNSLAHITVQYLFAEE